MNKTHVRRQREYGVLSALAAARSIAPQMGGWLTPMFCGGTDASHHSHTLRGLVARGLVEKKPRGGWTKTSWMYRIRPSGRARLKEHLERRKTIKRLAEALDA
jgi:hypothetical protein